MSSPQLWPQIYHLLFSPPQQGPVSSQLCEGGSLSSPQSLGTTPQFIKIATTGPHILVNSHHKITPATFGATMGNFEPHDGHLGVTLAAFGLHMLSDNPLNFSFPVLYSHRSFFGLPTVSAAFGVHPIGIQGLILAQV